MQHGDERGLKESAPANIYLSKVNNKNTRKSCKICSKLAIKITERHEWRRSGVFTFHFEHISHLFSSVPIVNFEQVIACWARIPNWY